MPESSPFKILLSHDQWATTQLLTVCDGLSADQFHRRFDIGPGSLHDTLAHIVAVLRTWTETLTGNPNPSRPSQSDSADSADAPRQTAQQLRPLLDEAYQAFRAEAHRRPLDEMVSRTRAGQIFHFTRGAVVTHVTTHNMHHRAQCLNMLRQLGITPLPLSSVADWTRMSDSQR